MQLKIQELEDQAERAEANKAELENYREKDFEIESLQGVLDEKETEITRLRTESDQLRVELESQVSGLQTTVAQQKEEIDAANGRIE